MSLYDVFEPSPSILCPECKEGYLHGWQGRYPGNTLFEWKQGVASPIDQPIDEDCKLSIEKRSQLRLPSDEDIWISDGSCNECGYCISRGLTLQIEERTWIGFKETRSEKFGEDIGQGWIQCPECCDAYEFKVDQVLDFCIGCNIILMKRLTN